MNNDSYALAAEAAWINHYATRADYSVYCPDGLRRRNMGRQNGGGWFPYSLGNLYRIETDMPDGIATCWAFKNGKKAFRALKPFIRELSVAIVKAQEQEGLENLRLFKSLASSLPKFDPWGFTRVEIPKHPGEGYIVRLREKDDPDLHGQVWAGLKLKPKGKGIDTAVFCQMEEDGTLYEVQFSFLDDNKIDMEATITPGDEKGEASEC